MAQAPTLPPQEHDDAEQTMAELLTAARERPGSDLDYLPKRISPSRASDYRQCPQMFYFKTICGMTTPNSFATTLGTLAHTAFERIFDHPAGQRTPEIAIGYIRPAWEQMTNLDLDEAEYPHGSPERARALADAQAYLDVATRGSERETELLETAADRVRAWFNMERVNNFSPLELDLGDGTTIDGREFHVLAEMFGTTVHGYIDRLDRWVSPGGEVVFSVSDYKTGKAPGEGKSYAPHTMERITYEAFFQLRLYAVLCQEMLGIRVKYLRLLYVKNGDKATGIKTMTVTDQILDNTRSEIAAIWRGIHRSATTGKWDPRTSKLCDWCDFVAVCPAFNPELDGLLPEPRTR